VTADIDQQWKNVPNKVFISYSYADNDVFNHVLSKLPGLVEPVTFYRADPGPSAPVSDGVVPAILECEAVICLWTRASANSLWVAFECDFALRAGKSVYLYDVESGTIHRDRRREVNLSTSLIVSREMEERSRELLNWLTTARHFDIDPTPVKLRLREVPLHMLEAIETHRPMLWLVDSYVAALAHLAFEVDPQMLHDIYYDPEVPKERFDGYRAWVMQNSTFARIDPDWVPGAGLEAFDTEERHSIFEVDPFYLIEEQLSAPRGSKHSVDLVRDVRPGTHFDWHRADDLIIRMTNRAQSFYSLI